MVHTLCFRNYNSALQSVKAANAGQWVWNVPCHASQPGPSLSTARYRLGTVRGVGARIPRRIALPSLVVTSTPPSAMHNKHNADRRHHIPKIKCTVTNWAEYEAGLRRRGSLTMWITEEAIAAWGAPRRSSPGGQAVYSDGAIGVPRQNHRKFRRMDCGAFRTRAITPYPSCNPWMMASRSMAWPLSRKA